MDAYKSICQFLGESPENIVYIWNINNVGGDSQLEDDEYASLVDRSFGKYIKMKYDKQTLTTNSSEKTGDDYDLAFILGPKPEEYLGKPKEQFVLDFSEKLGTYHEIFMYQSPDGLKFVSWSWDKINTDWICTRSLAESSFLNNL
jgi:hypothetical protein